MSWSTAPTAAPRRTGPAWTPTPTSPGRATGRGWFTTTTQKVVPLSGTGTLAAGTVAVKPRNTGALAGSGTLSATVRPKLAIAAVFTGDGEMFNGSAQTRNRAADFAATGSLDAVINDGLSAIVIGGVPIEDGLTATVGGGLHDGLTATVVPGVTAPVPVSATLASSGALSAAVKPVIPSAAPLTAVGTLSATLVPVGTGAAWDDSNWDEFEWV